MLQGRRAFARAALTPTQSCAIRRTAAAHESTYLSDPSFTFNPVVSNRSFCLAPPGGFDR